MRIGNGAAQHTQNDIADEMILALSPLYLDDRFADERSPEPLALVERLADKAVAVQGTPDAGIWEYRTEWQPQTFSSLMCWAAADLDVAHRRAARTALRDHYETAARAHPRAHRHRGVERAARQLVGTHGGRDLDAALLQMAPLRLLDPNDPKLVRTVDAISASLSNDWLALSLQPR